MPPGVVPYTLVGFGAELDWRPLYFVSPLPRVAVCSACGLVPTKTVVLTCPHVLCQYCYTLCEKDGKPFCPLDGLRIPEKKVKSMKTTAELVMKRQVKCWNKENGCPAIMTAPNIAHHFQFRCVHHAVHCPACSASVLRRSVCAHLRSHCASFRLVIPPPVECDVQTGNEDELALNALRPTLELYAGEIRALLEQSLTACNAEFSRLKETWKGVSAFDQELKQVPFQAALEIKPEALKESAREIIEPSQEMEGCSPERSDIVNNLSSRISSLEEEIKRELQEVTKKMAQNYLRLSSGIDSIKYEAKQNAKTMSNLIQFFQRTDQDVAQSDFLVQDIQSLHDVAILQGSAIYDSGKVYLRGYCVSPGVLIAINGQALVLYLGLQLHKGDLDNDVQWPFQYKFRFSVVHPREFTKRQLEFKPSLSCEFTQRPVGLSNQPFYYPEGSLNLYDLARDGYVYANRLRITLELL